MEGSTGLKYEASFHQLVRCGWSANRSFGAGNILLAYWRSRICPRSDDRGPADGSISRHQARVSHADGSQSPAKSGCMDWICNRCSFGLLDANGDARSANWNCCNLLCNMAIHPINVAAIVANI